MNPDTIFINIPVKDLDRSVNFYTRLGFTPHPVYRGPDCQCMILTDHIHVMVHLEGSLGNFTPKPVSDPAAATAAVLCLQCGSKEQVDELVATALVNGGSTYDAAQDFGFVYTHGFLDPDGNVWRLNHMNPDVPMPE